MLFEMASGTKSFTATFSFAKNPLFCKYEKKSSIASKSEAKISGIFIMNMQASFIIFTIMDFNKILGVKASALGIRFVEEGKQAVVGQQMFYIKLGHLLTVELSKEGERTVLHHMVIKNVIAT